MVLEWKDKHFKTIGSFLEGNSYILLKRQADPCSSFSLCLMLHVVLHLCAPDKCERDGRWSFSSVFGVQQNLKEMLHYWAAKSSCYETGDTVCVVLVWKPEQRFSDTFSSIKLLLFIIRLQTLCLMIFFFLQIVINFTDWDIILLLYPQNEMSDEPESCQ